MDKKLITLRSAMLSQIVARIALDCSYMLRKDYEKIDVAKSLRGWNRLKNEPLTMLNTSHLVYHLLDGIELTCTCEDCIDTFLDYEKTLIWLARKQGISQSGIDYGDTLKNHNFEHDPFH